MGFAVWMTNDEAWAQGTHEYRPMGCAVIARNGQFRAPDFSRYRRSPDRRSLHFIGLFGSLEEVNVFLRRSKPRAPDIRTPAIL
ncbi:MAG: hypothetical protein HYX27_20310 [Acidobacteria bacterium]|nr:hypothetical protein [Acidobacteriota bacterium]